MKDPAIYSDINSDDPCHSPLVYNNDAVMQALENLLSTEEDERLFSDVHCKLESTLFELEVSDFKFISMIRVKDAVKKYEPRVKVIPSLSSISSDPDRLTYNVVMTCEVLQTKERFELVGLLRP